MQEANDYIFTILLQRLTNFVEIFVLEKIFISTLYRIHQISICHGIILENILFSYSNGWCIRIISPAERYGGSVFSSHKLGFHAKSHMLLSTFIGWRFFKPVKVFQQSLHLLWILGSCRGFSGLEAMVEGNRHQKEVVL